MSDPDLSLLLKRSKQALDEDPDGARERFRDAASAAAPPRPVCPSCKRQIRHRLGLEWCEDRQMSEKTLQSRVRDRAKRRGWAVAHVGKGIAGFDEDRNPIFVTAMAEGWPDLTLAKAGHHLIFMELKRQEGEVEPKQLAWLQLLNETGNFAIVVRPSDLREGRVNVILSAGAPL